MRTLRCSGSSAALNKLRRAWGVPSVGPAAGAWFSIGRTAVPNSGAAPREAAFAVGSMVL